MADPTAVSGLLHRARASSLALSNGALVASWPLDAGGLTFAQGDSGLQPTYVTGGLAGQPRVRFAGSHGMQTTASMTSRAQPVTLVLVYRPDDVPSGQRNIVHFGDSETLEDGSEQPQVYAGSLLQATTAVSQTTGGVVTTVLNGVSSAVYVNGASSVTGSPGTGGLASAPITIGWHPTVGGREFSGDFYEFLVYDHALSAGERSVVHTYVQDIYGITVADYAAVTAIRGRPQLYVPRRRAANW